MIDLTKETPLRIKEAAKLYDVHRRTIENWIGRGLECATIGRLVYTSKEAIQRFSREMVRPIGAALDRSESSAARRASEAAKRRHRI